LLAAHLVPQECYLVFESRYECIPVRVYPSVYPTVYPGVQVDVDPPVLVFVVLE
jgi:hypothetical protein